MIIVCDAHEFAVHAKSLFGTKMAVFSALRRSSKNEARFDIYLYDEPEDQVTPTALISFAETSITAMLHLIKHHRDFSIIAEDGQRLAFTANSQTLAIYNSEQEKEPSAFIRLPSQITQKLIQPHIQEGFYRALGLRMPTLA